MRHWLAGTIGVIMMGLMGIPLVWGDATVENFFKTGGIKGMGAAEGMMTLRIQGEKKMGVQQPEIHRGFSFQTGRRDGHNHHHPGG